MSDSANDNLPVDWFERFEQGLTEFNEGKYYDCHETLERCWQEQGRLSGEMSDPHRQFVQGIIQIAVGYHHLERHNVKGALKLLRRGYDRIRNFPLNTYPLELSAFEAIVQSTIASLEGQPESLAGFSGGAPSGPPALQFPKIVHKPAI